MENALVSFKTLVPGKSFSEITKYVNSSENLIFDMNKKNGLAIVGGESRDEKAHIWVCEGGDNVQTTFTALNYKGEYVTTVTNDCYYYYNWGDCGKYNGFYFGGVFDQSKPSTRANYGINVRYFIIGK